MESPFPTSSSTPGTKATRGLSPLLRTWFEKRFHAPTRPQEEGWPVIGRGEDVLIAAPTGSGKTLTAFLTAIDRLLIEGRRGSLADETRVIYVSPMRALSHDIHQNLEAPLREIQALAAEEGSPVPEIRTAVRTGDTPQAERARMLRKPPHILVTTPESLYLLLTAARSRERLRGVDTVIVDEIHALAGNRRGAHLALSLARLERLVRGRTQRIGLSATARPLDLLARFLVGGDRCDPAGRPQCRVLDLGHLRRLDLGIVVPSGEDLSSGASTGQMADILDLLAEHIRDHRTTLVFVNTRKLAERTAHLLSERLGPEVVAAHHGSLSRERRLLVEQRLRSGDLRAMVATASLELGIDIGHIDLVCQIASPRSIAVFLQRIGRSGHALGLTPKGRLFPTSRDDLIECAALVRAVRAGRLDRIHAERAPLDVLGQQIVAACAAGDRSEEELFSLVRDALPYADLRREDFDAVIDMLCAGFETPRGRRGRLLRRDRARGMVRGRRGARLTALTSGGAIPESGDYRVVLHPEGIPVGSVNEDWAVESNVGDIFLLGTHSWRVHKVEDGIVHVTDAEGAPPTIPFWLGEAPGRTNELSGEVSDLRRTILRSLSEGDTSWGKACGLCPSGVDQALAYVKAQRDAVGVVPTREDILVERFFDESGGMQLVVHAPYGARINRAFGLALRKRFCRSFNQELQAAANDNGLLLSLANPQTFRLETIGGFLSPETIEDVLAQAFLGSPLFRTRWRWNAARALALPRFQGGRKVPFNVQRMQADDLLTAAFPTQTACQEHVTWPIDIPDHPLVRQTIEDCLREASDVDGLRALLEGLAIGAVRLHCRDTTEPSPFAHEILGAGPFAFLDDAPLEERRARAVAMRRTLPVEAGDLGRLSEEAIARVRMEAAPDIRDSADLLEVLEDVLLQPAGEFAELLEDLVASGLAGIVVSGSRAFAYATSRLRWIPPLLPAADAASLPEPPAWAAPGPEDETAARDRAVQEHLALLGPATPETLAERIPLPAGRIQASLERLEARGVALSGTFDPALEGRQFCERSLLARIHRKTITGLRSAIQPVSARIFWRFLLRWQHVHPDERMSGESGLMKVIEGLSGWQAPGPVWERDLLASRVRDYSTRRLDALCLGGRVSWGRLRPGSGRLRTPLRSSPVSFFPREESESLLHELASERTDLTSDLREAGRTLLDLLGQRGALFHAEMVACTRLLPFQLEEGLLELLARGLLTADSFQALRVLMRPGARQRARRRRLSPPAAPDPQGRFSLLRPLGPPPQEDDLADGAAMRLLRRYGVVFRDLAAREITGLPWRLIHRALRRLEARGLVRGGHFVAGFSGEHFALPEAVPTLRAERRRPADGERILISACDPLNLQGILTPGPRVPARHTIRIVLQDGLPVETIEEEAVARR